LATALSAMMKWLKKLDNPFLLMAEGFVAGAFLFWATTPASVQAQANPRSAQLESPASPAAPL
jgi:hypothetical protein